MTKNFPNGWRTVQLGELCDVCRGSSPRPIADQRYFEGGTIPWIKIADATKSGKYLYTTKEHVNEFGASFSRLLPKGSLIIAASGTLGYPQFLGVEGCAHDGWLIPSNYRELDKHFLYYLFLWKKEFFYSSAYGAAIQNINTMILREMEISIPDLPVQHKIAGILSAYDDLIENNTRRIAILEEMAQAIYRQWFVHFRFPGHEKVNLINSPLGKIPDGWTTLKMGDVLTIRYGKNLPTTQVLQTGEFPVYGAGGIIGYYDSCISESKTALVTCRGNGSGTVWRTREAAFITNNSFYISPLPLYSHWTYGFIEVHLKHSNVAAALSGSAQPQITIDGLSQVEFCVPDKATVSAFAPVVDEFNEMIDSLVRKNINLRATRDLLLPKLISGRLDVEDLDIETGQPLVEAVA